MSNDSESDFTICPISSGFLKSSQPHPFFITLCAGQPKFTSISSGLCLLEVSKRIPKYWKGQNPSTVSHWPFTFTWRPPFYTFHVLSNYCLGRGHLGINKRCAIFPAKEPGRKICNTGHGRKNKISINLNLPITRVLIVRHAFSLSCYILLLSCRSFDTPKLGMPGSDGNAIFKKYPEVKHHKLAFQ